MKFRAQSDLGDGRGFTTNTKKIRPGLGKRFLGRLEETFARIADNPTIYAVVYKNARRAIVRRFPYSVYFRIEESGVKIEAVIHNKRHSRTWKSRLD